MTEPQELLIGAVAYTANVVPIWEGIREYFADSDAPMDFVLFSNYERQVEALLAGHIDIAWNTNVAWIRTLRRTNGTAKALATRDTDLVFTTVMVGRAGSGLSGLEALKGRRVALGSRDSGQARILPLHFMNRAGVTPDDVELVIFDSDVGKHGDTGRSDLDALRAVIDDEADVAAIGVNTWNSLRSGGDDSVADLEVVWESEHYSHCNFSALETLDDKRIRPWLDHLLAMDWENPEHRRILELEGLTQWKLPQLDGYGSLVKAMDEQQISDRW
ncbi:Rv1680 family SBP-like protein [Candidatus Microthrix parvicella]|uniref:Rv1680 family SBP-like protein n=1 Tax=Candidatus Neomicrothrix parvicella TaxID=41950 RepID=UPI00037C2694|nr:PhnD/SsuA/transferrin family substrate-binding protein [Candidatus Microthrix parvicella]